MNPRDQLESFEDFSPEADDFLSDVIRGLGRPQKTLPCKYFYDEQGSRLFDLICELPEYYPTRTENALLAGKGAEIAACVGPSAQIVEYGCGSVQKVRILLDALDRPAAYVAVDISREHLLSAAAALAADYPGLEVRALCADFTRPFDVQSPKGAPDARKVGFFPGSTIGNFEREAAIRFLSSAATSLGPGGGMVIGADLKKDEAVLHAAYNDSQGVTAAFNLNLLRRVNRELGGNFDLSLFRHAARYNAAEGRIEMYLLSEAVQTVRIGGREFRFARGESIHTENSHKYGIEEFQELARAAGFAPMQVWTDPDRLFSIHYLEVPDGQTRR